jgi:hypothetical protein
MGPAKGISDISSAADAPTMASMSGSFSWSMDSTVAMTWVSNRYALGNRGPNGPVDQTGGEGFFLAGPADLPSKVIARDAAGRIDFFLIFHGKGQKIDISLVMLAETAVTRTTVSPY